MNSLVDQLKTLKLPLGQLVDIVSNDTEYHDNSIFDYLWDQGLTDVDTYKLISKSFFFQSEYVIKKIMTVYFPPSLIVIFIKRTRLGLSKLMLEFLTINKPSGSDMAYLLYDSPEFLNDDTFALLLASIRTYHEATTIIDNSRNKLTDEQRVKLLNLALHTASEHNDRSDFTNGGH